MNLSVLHTTSDNFAEYEQSYLAFLRQIESNNSPALENMGDTSPGGMLTLIRNKKRWTSTTGQIAFLHDDNLSSIVGVSAVEHSTLHVDLGSGGNRCWVLPPYRQNNGISKYLLASNLDWCKQQGKSGMLLTFNDYNKPIYEMICKFSSGRGAAFGNIWSNWWNDCVPLPRKIRLHNTPQWAVIKPISNVIDIAALLDNKFGVRDTPFISTK